MSALHNERAQANAPLPDWQPAVDIVELADRFELTADLPGVLPEDIDVSLDGQVLRLSGQHRCGASARKRHVGERATGLFCRLFTLPVSVDGERIAARATNGTLHLAIPKHPEIVPRRIAVNAA